MDIVLLIKSGMGLVVTLAFLIFLLFYSLKIKKEKAIATKAKKSVVQKVDKVPTFESLRAVIKNKKATSDELKGALDEIIKYYGKVSNVSGKSTHADFDIYLGIVFSICRHPNTTKDIIINFDKELTKLNPEYKSDINDAITKGLNSRGV